MKIATAMTGLAELSYGKALIAICHKTSETGSLVKGWLKNEKG